MRALKRHVGTEVGALGEASDERWAVERGLQVCAQNVLDIATHIAAGLGHDVADYASAIDTLGEVGALPADGRLSEFTTFARHIEGFLEGS